MKNLVKPLCIAIAFASTLCFTSCNHCVETKEEKVTVTIVDSYYFPMWIQQLKCGDVTTYIVHDEIKEITVEYDGERYTSDNENAYDEYQNSIGESAEAVLVTKYYSNGKEKKSVKFK